MPGRKQGAEIIRVTHASGAKSMDQSLALIFHESSEPWT